MGKGGGGKGGGGGGKAPQINIPYAQLGQIYTGAQNLQQMEQEYITNPNTLLPLAAYGQGFMSGGVLGPGGEQQNISPMQWAQIGLANEEQLFPQYQQQVNFANQLAQMGLSEQEQAQALQAAGYGQLTQAQTDVRGLETGTGLYPSQQAYVNQAVQSGQAAVQQQLASEGLTASTQNAMLQNQVAQAGAATAGQLVQGNIQLGQAQESLAMNQIQLGQQAQQLAQQLTMGEQGIGIGGIQSLQNLWGTVASQYAGMEEQGFKQALGGYGLIGNFFEGALQPYGYMLKDLEVNINAQLANAELTQKQFLAEQEAQSQGMSSMMGGLGSILGGLGGQGGLLGGIGGLFGGGAAAGAGAGSLAAGLTGAGAAGAGLGAGATAALGGTIAEVAGLAIV